MNNPSCASGLLALNVESVSIDLLVAAGSPRLEGESIEHARTLAQSETDFPPIIVHRPSMRVIDGAHRLRAATYQGRAEIDVNFFEGSEEDAFVLAVESNVQHGLPLTLSDRTAAARRIVTSHPEWSDRAIAAVTGLAAKTVGAIRRRSATGEVLQLHSRIGRDGKTRPVSTAEGRRVASTLLMENPGASLREVAKAAGVSPGTVRDVRQRLQRNEDPVPSRQRRAELKAAKKICAAVSGTTGSGARVEFAEVGGPERKMAIQALMRDPQLRMSDEGRLLLRLFTARVVDERHRQRLIRWIPSRWRRTVTELAYSCSRDWYDFARQLEACDGGGAADDKRVLEEIG
ncbi:winged helix-turn-helix transcriptional regulator [Streptomyces sp. NPDC004296]|uniref:winged helix-turn-helix transcriptional regulator n=1 Tax=Streptomyces sp. NPDC004296 TaxID=3364697 RepID=UPI0036BCF490